MSSPIAIGARSTTAPPGDTRSARVEQELDDRPLLDAVRAGDLHAFGTLYERHVGAARALARRLCTNRADVDDVVGDAFTNTLRAIKSGRGPRDDLRSYVLTAVRNTVIKSQTRRDPARAVPTAHEHLDAPQTDDPYRCADPIAHAFVQLPDRFRDVLWSTCVEGHGPQDVAARTAMSTGAVTSLTLRARRALMRSYFVSRIEQPEVSPDCAPVRQLLPTLLEGDAAPSTVNRVEMHLATCPHCELALAEMRALAAHIRSSFPWFAAALAWTRLLLSRAAAPASGAACAATGGSTLVAAVMLMAVASGDRPFESTPDFSSPRPVMASIATTADTAAAWAEIESSSTERNGRGAADQPRTTDVSPRAPSLPRVIVREPASVPVRAAVLEPVAEREPAAPSSPFDPVVPALDPEIGSVRDPIPEPVVSPVLDAVEPVVEPIVATVATGAGLVLDDVVVPVADAAATTAASVAEAAATVVTDVAEPAITPAIGQAAEVADATATVSGDVVEAADPELAGALLGAVDRQIVQLP